MEEKDTFRKGPPIATRGVHAHDASNAMQLSTHQWIGVAAFALAVGLLTPMVWSWAEKLGFEPDYRLPYELSNDYWLYDRWARLASTHCDTVMIGDSVVWGQYVTRPQTLTHHLNQLAGRERFANLGLDGAHPAALAGLVEHYGAGIRGKTIVLNCNPLWMSSPQRDLQEKKELEFNHPELVPQFSPWIACYKETVTNRLGNVIDRNVEFNGWTRHLQHAYFDHSTVPQWTLDHPYTNPFRVLTFRLPPSDNRLRHSTVSWTKRGIEPQDFPWISLDSSLQWRSFLRAVKILQRRGNRVVVFIGPFNEHLLTPESRARYGNLKADIGSRLRTLNIPSLSPSVLPSELYADASHPLAEGYAMLAKEIWVSDQLRK